MTREEARQRALGYAGGREDASGTPTQQSPLTMFSWAYADAWDDYNNKRRDWMPTTRMAYDTWQETGGRTIFPADRETAK